MTNVVKSGDKQKQARATFEISDYQFGKTIALFVKNNLSAAREMTKNGALKLTTSRPEVKADIKGKVEVDGKTFYLIPSTPNTKGVLSALVSYCDYLEAVRILAKKQENTKDFDEYISTVDAKRQFKAARKYAPKTVSDETIWKDIYSDYLKERGL